MLMKPIRVKGGLFGADPLNLKGRVTTLRVLKYLLTRCSRETAKRFFAPGTRDDSEVELISPPNLESFPKPERVSTDVLLVLHVLKAHASELDLTLLRRYLMPEFYAEVVRRQYPVVKVARAGGGGGKAKAKAAAPAKKKKKSSKKSEEAEEEEDSESKEKSKAPQKKKKGTEAPKEEEKKKKKVSKPRVDENGKPLPRPGRGLALTWGKMVAATVNAEHKHIADRVEFFRGVIESVPSLAVELAKFEAQLEPLEERKGLADAKLKELVAADKAAKAAAKAAKEAKETKKPKAEGKAKAKAKAKAAADATRKRVFEEEDDEEEDEDEEKKEKKKEKEKKEKEKKKASEADEDDGNDDDDDAEGSDSATATATSGPDRKKHRGA